VSPRRPSQTLRCGSALVLAASPRPSASCSSFGQIDSRRRPRTFVNSSVATRACIRSRGRRCILKGARSTASSPACAYRAATLSAGTARAASRSMARPSRTKVSSRRGRRFRHDADEGFVTTRTKVSSRRGRRFRHDAHGAGAPLHGERRARHQPLEVLYSTDYITTAAAPHLDGHHVIFGKVLSGMATVEAIAALPVDDRERPARGREVLIHDCGEVTNIL
jgi:Cyclophilin type peptidyl-prolyl cis-trans isomerase/CLD